MSKQTAPTIEDFKRIRKVLSDQAVPKDGRYYRIAIHPDALTPEFRAQCKRWGWKIVEESCPTNPPKPN